MSIIFPVGVIQRPLRWFFFFVAKKYFTRYHHVVVLLYKEMSMSIPRRFSGSSFEDDVIRMRIAFTTLAVDGFEEINKCPISTIILATTSLFTYGLYIPYYGQAYVLKAGGTCADGVLFHPHKVEHAWIVHAESGAVIDIRQPLTDGCAVNVFEKTKPVYLGKPFTRSMTSPKLVWLQRILTSRMPPKKK